MKVLSSLTLIFCLVVGNALFVACGGSDRDDASASPDTQSSTPQGGMIAESVESGDVNWGDIPVFPGAHALEKDNAMFQKMVEKSHTRKGDMRIYETDAAREEVLSYYEKTLPDQGWTKIMGMPMGERAVLTTWSKTDENRGITISVSESPQENKVYFTIIQGQD